MQPRYYKLRKCPTLQRAQLQALQRLAPARYSSVPCPSSPAEEFQANLPAVNCVSIGSKSTCVLATGGEDKLVNLWTIGTAQRTMVCRQPTELVSRPRKTSPLSPQARGLPQGCPLLTTLAPACVSVPCSV